MNKKIFSLNLSNLKNGEHYDFNDIVVKAIILFALQDGTYKRYIKAYREAFDYENEVYKKYDRKYATSQYSTAVQVRDSEFRILRDMLKILVIENNGALKPQAERLLGAIDLYGGGIEIPLKGGTEKTGIYTNLIEDFETKYSAEVEATGIGAALAHLKESNEICQQRLQERSLADSEIGKDAMAIARLQVDKYYRAMINVMNADMTLGETALYPFADYMNVEIDRFRILIGQGVAGANKPVEDSEETDGDETVEKPLRKVTLTFKSLDGRETVREGRPGDEYQVPATTEGRIWVTEGGLVGLADGVYPTVSLEFHEVAADLPKATFHFLDGAHITITGETDSLYEIPANSTGYHWQPEPNGHIPEADTQYFEVENTETDEDEDEDQGGEQTLTPGMDWPFDVPAPEGWTKVIFRDKDGRETVKLYRNGSSVYSQGGYPENAPGYEWIGIHAILNGTTHTITEYEE